MLHLDEGTIHELLDGELDPPHAAAVRAHIGECAECLRLYEEAQDMLAEADRVISSLSGTSGPRLSDRELVAAAAPRLAAAADVLPSPSAASVGAGVPVVLIPQRPAQRWRMPRRRSYFWAAGLVAAAGVGYMLFGVRRAELTRASDMASRTFNAPPPAVTAPAPAPGTVAGKAVVPGSSAVASRRADARAKAAAPADSLPTPARVQSSGPEAQVASKSARTAQPSAPQLAAAAPPLGANPARAEFAAESNRVMSDPAPGAATPGAATPSPEARAQITTRIGLDEAKRELGGPLHGIDGLRPAFIGLIPGRLVPGADPSRDVVRAVYVDANDRQFYLDQQRVSPSLARARGNAAADNTSPRANGLARGDVQLMLHGQVPADTLRALEPRVR